jgi:uncharacterized membrane protein YphA (DoxX/SURF4 family)
MPIPRGIQMGSTRFHRTCQRITAMTTPALPPAPSSALERGLQWLTWPAAIWIAYELLWYEQFKLTGNEGSVALFTVLSDWLGTPGGEKPFRLFVAIMEIVAAIMVVLPRTRAFGGLFTMAVMGGAIFFHIVSPLGIDPYNDGGKLFKEACFTFATGLFIAIVYRRELRALAGRVVPALAA